MDRGYIKVWRKIRDNPVLHERGKRYSRYEAWLYLCLEARGTDDPKTGLKRGEFEASYRYLAKAWNWSLGAVQRFMADLEKPSGNPPEPMIMRVIQSPIHYSIQQAIRFKICKYELYNEARYSKRYTERYSQRYKSKEGFNKVESPLTPKGGSAEPVNGNGAKPPAFVNLILNDKSTYPVLDDAVAHYQELYPSVNVRAELRSMAGWCEGNPARRKTRRGIEAFIHRWLAKDQDKGSRSTAPKPTVTQLDIGQLVREVGNERH